MSNGRPFRRHLVGILGPLDGARIDGGCPDCTAAQTVRALADGVWQVDVLHEPTCPTLAAIEAHR